jgi:hypothetical protein
MASSRAFGYICDNCFIKKRPEIKEMVRKFILLLSQLILHNIDSMTGYIFMSSGRPIRCHGNGMISPYLITKIKENFDQ